MLQLVRELAQKMGLGVAWHTGAVPQLKRREEINRFKKDPHCRLFLSTDSGSVGLNLQAANIVINLDLPWNPAKLGQRIARAWRKHQNRHVQVINLITNHSIEHRMIGILNQKQALAQGVLHGDNNLSEMKLPSGRNAFMERVAELLQEPQSVPAPTPPHHKQWDQLPKEVYYLSICKTDTLPPVVLAVAEQNSPALYEKVQSVLNTHYPQETPELELLDPATFNAVQRLVQAGLLTLHPQLQVLQGSAEIPKSAVQTISPYRLNAAKEKQQQAKRSMRLTELLISEQFYPEALTPLRETMESLLTATIQLCGPEETITHEPIPYPQIEQLIKQKAIPASSLPLAVFLRENPNQSIEHEIQKALQDSQNLLKSINFLLSKTLPLPSQACESGESCKDLNK